MGMNEIISDVINWGKIQINLAELKSFVIFVDIYNDLNILNKQTFNLIKIIKYRNEETGEDMFLITDSNDRTITRFADFNFFLRQLR